jgi:hypothetical protein
MRLKDRRDRVLLPTAVYLPDIEKVISQTAAPGSGAGFSTYAEAKNHGQMGNTEEPKPDPT